MDDLDATILRALAANDPTLTDDGGLLGEDEFLEQLLKVTGGSLSQRQQDENEMPSISSLDIEPIEFLSNLTQTHNDPYLSNGNNVYIKNSAAAAAVAKNLMDIHHNGGTKGLMDFLTMCENKLDSSGVLEDDPYEPIPIKPDVRQRRKRRSVPNLAQARLPAVEFIRNASIEAMQQQPPQQQQMATSGMDEAFLENSRKLDMFLQENFGGQEQHQAMETCGADDAEQYDVDQSRVTTGKRRREQNGRNSLPTMRIGENNNTNSNNNNGTAQQRPAPLLSQADLEGLDLTDYEDNFDDAEGGSDQPPILDQAPLMGVTILQGAETHSMQERLHRISSGDSTHLQQQQTTTTSGEPHQERIRRLSGSSSVGGVEERLGRISVDSVDESEARHVGGRGRNNFTNQSSTSMGETHSMEERLRRISTESLGLAASEPVVSPERMRFAPSFTKRNSPNTGATHSMEERLRRISADSIMAVGNAAKAETHSMEERLRRISADNLSVGSCCHNHNEKDVLKRGGSGVSSHASETHSMEERLKRISGSNGNLPSDSVEDRIRRVSEESSQSLSANAQRGGGGAGGGWGLTFSLKPSEGRHSYHGGSMENDERFLQGMNADLIEKSAAFDIFLATRGEFVTAPTTNDSEEHPAPKRRKSLEQQRSSLPPMHISTDGDRPLPLLSKTDLADLELSDFEDSTDDDCTMSPQGDQALPRFAVDMERKGGDRRKSFGSKRRGRQNSLPNLRASSTDSSSKSESTSVPPKRSESSSPPVDSNHDPLGLLARLRNLMKRTQKTQQALQQWDKLHGLPKSHSQTMVNSSRSRRQIQEGRIIPKWDGTPLINEETQLGKPKPRAKLLNKSTKK